MRFDMPPPRYHYGAATPLFAAAFITRITLDLLIAVSMPPRRCLPRHAMALALDVSSDTQRCAMLIQP